MRVESKLHGVLESNLLLSPVFSGESQMFNAPDYCRQVKYALVCPIKSGSNP